MHMYVAHTYEIDSPERAVYDIVQALPSDILSKAKKNHAVGIITTHADAVVSGVVRALCDAMPFDVVGMTCLASCGDGEVDLGLLTFVLLVDENLFFTSTLTDALFYNDEVQGTYKKSIALACEKLKSEFTGDYKNPALTLAYAPFSTKLSGQNITDAISEAIGETPLFGGLASDHTADASDTFVIYNGESTKNKLALVCIAGNIKTTFAYASLQPDNIQHRESIITMAKGTTVYAVNNKPVTEYFSSLGLSLDEWSLSSTLVPFLVDYKDGSPTLARELLEISPDKSANFGGDMPVGASINLGLQTPEGILNTAQIMLKYILENKDNIDGVLVVGCAGRSVILGGSPLVEGEEALNVIQQTMPYHQLYARGEICPTVLPNGTLQNRFHNFSFTICMFEKSSVKVSHEV